MIDTIRPSTRLARAPSAVRALGGALVGVRVRRLRTRTEWGELNRAFLAAAEGVAAPLVVYGDYSGLTPLSEEVANAVLQGLRSFNPKLRRAALLLPERSAVLRLQMERLLREARSAARRVCVDQEEAKAWLAPCLDSAELGRLNEFIG